MGKWCIKDRKGCIQVKSVVFVQKWFYRGKVVVLGHKWLYSCKVDDIGKTG